MSRSFLRGSVRGCLHIVLLMAIVCGVLIEPSVASASHDLDLDPGAHRLRIAARRALAYLSSQLLPDGSLDHRASETEDFILATVAAGRDPNDLVAPSGKSVFDFLAANIADATSDVNRTGKLVQAVVAAGRNPRNFAGQNLLAKIEGPHATAGGFYDPVTGAFNNGINATFHQSNAILGLVAADDDRFPVTAKAVSFLKSLQVTSGPGAGGWPADTTANTNSTAMALMALAARRDHSADPAALAFLHTQQDPATGGFAFTTLGPWGSTDSDPDSDALVVQGLVAARQNPRGRVWTNAHGNALTDVLRFQDPATGGFFFLPGSPPDAFTTSFIPAGLLRSPFPILPDDRDD
ncbi:hypothetical protein [Pendulispora albinea]|uniref:Squalene cyclase C-terminal domain-containing protein n=1 Tax=Pendulispora albinea TaxID=2741071 RepID=A0ABZ2LW04_9BACT